MATFTSKTEKYLVFNVDLLRYLGIWPYQDGTTPWKKTLSRIMSLFIFLQLVVFYITELIDFFVNWGNIIIMTESMCQISASTLLIYKISYIVYKRTRFQKLIDVLENNFFMSEDAINKGQQSVIKNYNRQVKVFTIFYMCLGSFTALFWICVPFIDEDNEKNGLPFRIWTPFDISQSSPYAIMYAVHVTHAFIYVIYVPAIGMFIVGTILHACGQFKLLHSSLIDLREIVLHRMSMGNQTPTSEARTTYSAVKTHHDRDFYALRNKSDDINIYGITSLEIIRQSSNNVTGVHMDMEREMFLSLKQCIVHHQIILRQDTVLCSYYEFRYLIEI
jgi:hypothetical protein